MKGQVSAVLTVFVVVTHLGLGERDAARFNGGLLNVSGAFGADATGTPVVYGVLLDAGGGLLVNRAVVTSVDGEGRAVRRLDAGAVLAFSNVNSAGVVVVVVLVYLDTGLGKVGSRRTAQDIIVRRGMDGSMDGWESWYEEK